MDLLPQPASVSPGSFQGAFSGRQLHVADRVSCGRFVAEGFWEHAAAGSALVARWNGHSWSPAQPRTCRSTTLSTVSRACRVASASLSAAIRATNDRSVAANGRALERPPVGTRNHFDPARRLDQQSCGRVMSVGEVVYRGGFTSRSKGCTVDPARASFGHSLNTSTVADGGLTRSVKPCAGLMVVDSVSCPSRPHAARSGTSAASRSMFVGTETLGRGAVPGSQGRHDLLLVSHLVCVGDRVRRSRRP